VFGVIENDLRLVLFFQSFVGDLACGLDETAQE